MDPMSESKPPDNPHALPPALVVILFATLAGGLGPGVFMTLTGGPGSRGTPLHGLLLPWTILPFLVAVGVGWKARFHPSAKTLAIVTSIAAAGGLSVYLYGLLIHPAGAENTQLFKWVPAVQLLLIVRVALRAWQAAGRTNPD